MRVIVSSIPRAKALSKALRHLLAAEGLTIRDGEAKAALAAMLGYASWAELRLVASRGDLDPAPFDETCGPEFAERRRAFQADRLSLSTNGTIPRNALLRLVTALAPCGRPSVRWTKPRPVVVSMPPEFPRQAMHPIDWLCENGVRLSPGIALDDAGTLSALSRQVDRPWKGIDALAPHERILAAAFAVHVTGDRTAAEEVLRLREESGLSGSPDLHARMRRVLADPAVREAIEAAASGHAYVPTVLARLLGNARRKVGVVTTHTFHWLREVDRTLWYGLQNVGRRDCFVEGAGIVAHLGAEMGEARPLDAIAVGPALAGIKGFLDAHGADGVRAGRDAYRVALVH
jgi:intracellular multiplication protein IcmP